MQTWASVKGRKTPTGCGRDCVIVFVRTEENGVSGECKQSCFLCGLYLFSSVADQTNKRAEDVERRDHGANHGPSSTLHVYTNLVQAAFLCHPHRRDRHRVAVPERLPDQPLHPHLPDRGGGLRSGAESGLLPARNQAEEGRARHPADPRLQSLELTDVRLLLLLVYHG